MTPLPWRVVSSYPYPSSTEVRLSEYESLAGKVISEDAPIIAPKYTADHYSNGGDCHRDLRALVRHTRSQVRDGTNEAASGTSTRTRRSIQCWTK